MLFNLLFILPVLAAPAIPNRPASISALSSSNFHSLATSFPQGCPTTNIVVPVAAGMSVPAGQKVSAVTVGRGVQNYTCTNGAWVSAGALANLYDVSCLFNAVSKFANSTTVASILPKVAFKSLSYPDTSKLPVAIHHTFIPTPGSTGISPKFASSSASIAAAKLVSDPSSNPTTDVPSLQLAALAGQNSLASTVFRLDTVNGQPPTSCPTNNASLSVQYAAMYFFTK